MLPSLYNGNISNSTYAIAEINNGATMGYSYNYDQLNRIKNVWQHDIGPGTWGYVNKIEAFKESFTYDGNGNIKSLLRNNVNGVPMDNLSYAYNYQNGKLSNNKLNAVDDAVATASIDFNDTNYDYDQIGNLVTETTTGLPTTTIDWNVYGKIKSIKKAGANFLTYGYDPSGNRVVKNDFALGTTWYVRDAQGNQLAVYDNISGAVKLKEQDLYGSSRLGMWKPDATLANNGWNNTGLKFFELSNHLGNVMAVINDTRNYMSSVYAPNVVNAQDYYAFGGTMDGRKSGVYRYGFNGKENDNEVKGEGNQQDYGMRIYDPRIAKFLSVDPITNQYPELTPYQFAGNTPIQAVDLDGLEPKGVVKEKYNTTSKIVVNEFMDSDLKEPINVKTSVVTYKFTEAAIHMLNIVSRISKEKLRKIEIADAQGSMMPSYDVNKGGGALTFPGGTEGYKIHYTHNWFSNRYFESKSVQSWLSLSSHEVRHTLDIDEIGGGKTAYVATFIAGYIQNMGHDGLWREQRAEEGTTRFDRFVEFVNDYYGLNKLSELFNNPNNKDKDIIGRIDQWWNRYQSENTRKEEERKRRIIEKLTTNTSGNEKKP